MTGELFEGTRHHLTPRVAGFYWAKWRMSEDDTLHDLHKLPSDAWEVVEVFDCGGTTTGLAVNLFGIDKSEVIENFLWGPKCEPPPEIVLAPYCETCDGRGWTGGTKQTPRALCRECKGAKRVAPKPRSRWTATTPTTKT